jgi:hypothetical protein
MAKKRLPFLGGKRRACYLIRSETITTENSRSIRMQMSMDLVDRDTSWLPPELADVYAIMDREGAKLTGLKFDQEVEGINMAFYATTESYHPLYTQHGCRIFNLHVYCRPGKKGGRSVTLFFSVEMGGSRQMHDICYDYHRRSIAIEVTAAQPALFTDPEDEEEQDTQLSIAGVLYSTDSSTRRRCDMSTTASAASTAASTQAATAATTPTPATPAEPTKTAAPAASTEATAAAEPKTRATAAAPATTASTTTAPVAATTSEPSEAATNPQFRDAVLVDHYDAKNHNNPTVGIVLGADYSSKELLAPGGEPAITVAIVDPTTTARILGSARWSNAFLKLHSVLHYTHPNVEKGTAVSAWREIGGQLPTLLPTLSAPPSNPMYQRQQFHDRFHDGDTNHTRLQQVQMDKTAAALAEAKVEAAQETATATTDGSGTTDATSNTPQTAAA